MKAKIAKKSDRVPRFLDYLIPEFLVACHEAILGQDNGLTLVKIIDQLVAVLLPLQVPRFFTVGQFIRRTEIDVNEFINAGLYFKLLMVKPSGQERVLAEGPVLMNRETPWLSTRLMNDFSGTMVFDEIGMHKLKIAGKTSKSDFEEVLEKQIFIIPTPGITGLYLAQFYAGDDKNKEESAGSGIVMLMPNLTVQGGDYAYTYSGTYKLDGSKITAEMHVVRHNPGAPSVFGDIERFELDLDGVVSGLSIDAHGSMKDAPNGDLHIQMVKQLKAPNPVPQNQSF